MSAATPIVPAITIPYSGGNSGFNSPLSSPTRGSGLPLSLTGAAVGSGATQLAANQPGTRAISSPSGQISAQHVPIVDFNTFNMNNVLDPDILHPIDDFLDTNLVQGVTTKDTKASLRFYSMEPNAIMIQGTTDIDISRIRVLLSLLRDLRRGQSNLDTCDPEMQRDLATLCGIPFKDTDPHSIAAGIALITTLFLPSFESVATQSDEAWHELKVKGLRTHLGILGMTIDADTTTKPELRDLVPRARFLAVSQGILIPAIRSPFRGFFFPDESLFMQTSTTFQTTLVVSVLDLDIDQIPAREVFFHTISSFRGTTANLSFFDSDQWARLPDAIDRAVFLHMFLAAFGVPFHVLTILTPADLLALLPSGHMDAVPIHRPAVTVCTPPDVRKRRRAHEAIMASVNAAPIGPTTASIASRMAVPICPPTTTPGPLHMGPNPLIPVMWSPTTPYMPPATGTAHCFPTPASAGATFLYPPMTTTTLQSYISTPSAANISTLHGSSVGLGATQLTLNSSGGHGGSSMQPTSQETRFITDAAYVGMEYTQKSLENLPTHLINFYLVHFSDLLAGLHDTSLHSSSY